MRKPKINQQYFTICVYVFIVVVITTLGILLGIYLPEFIESVAGFLNAAKAIIYGLCFAYFINYILKFLEVRIFHRISSPILKRLAALATSYIFLILIVGNFFWLIIPEIVSNYSSLVDALSNAITALLSWLDTLVGDSMKLLDTTLLTTDLEKFLNGIFDFGGTVLTELGNIVIGFILSFYVLLRKEVLGTGAKSLLGLILPAKFNKRFASFVDMLNNVFGRYFMGTIVASFFVGLETLIGCLVLRIPYAYLVCVIVAFTNVIPYFGPFLGAIPSCIIIFTVSPIKAIWFALLILVIQQIDGNFITPRIIGSSVGLGSIWIIISILLFSAIFGIIGMIIGVPLFTVIYNIIRDTVNSRLERKGYPTEASAYEKMFGSLYSDYTDTEHDNDGENEEVN